MSPPELAAALDLAPHPEGGWYRRTWTSPTTVATPGGERPTATSILYLMDGPGRWHRVRSTELWLWHSGPVAALVLGGDGEGPGHEELLRLGPADPGAAPAGSAGGTVPGSSGPSGTGGSAAGGSGAGVGTLPQREVPAGVWQRAYPLGDGPVLVSCVVSPGFDFADFELR